MSNADLFLSHFIEIEKHLIKKAQNTEYTPFRELVRQLIRKNDAVVRRFKDDLYQYASLRNAIVHEKRGNVSIAEPYVGTVEALEKIKEEIIKPKKVIPTFQFSVFSISTDTYLEDVLSKMKEGDFSQAPLLDKDGEVMEIITTNTISRWLFGKINEDIISLKETMVSDLVPYIEHEFNYKIIDRDTTIFEAADIFITQMKKKIDI